LRIYVSWLVSRSWARFLYLILALTCHPCDRTPQDKLPDTIPIFPLEDVMLFPECRCPLHIFEPRYKR
jgi:hypothetical protein